MAGGRILPVSDRATVHTVLRSKYLVERVPKHRYNATAAHRTKAMCSPTRPASFSTWTRRHVTSFDYARGRNREHRSQFLQPGAYNQHRLLPFEALLYPREDELRDQSRRDQLTNTPVWDVPTAVRTSGTLGNLTGPLETTAHARSNSALNLTSELVFIDRLRIRTGACPFLISQPELRSSRISYSSDRPL